MSSTWGKIIKLSLFGESHGTAIGMTLDGLPPGQHIDLDNIRSFLQRRAPGRAEWMSERKENDEFQILSGLNDGFTTGAPLAALLENNNKKCDDYQNIRHIPRPGHADFTARIRYGQYTDPNGGGHLSGRLTAPFCLAGAIALQILAEHNIFIGAHLSSIAKINDIQYDPVNLTQAQLLLAGEKDFPVNDNTSAAQMKNAIMAARAEKDSLGGIIECAALGIPPGLGSPLFEGIENRLAQILFAIPALTGLEFGAGFAGTGLRASQINDPFMAQQGQIRTKSNNHGGILGGISSGMPLIFKVAIKPTPSIALTQCSVDLTNMEETTIAITGRHDPCIAPRAVPCIEAATALCILDLMLEQGKI